MDFKVYRVEFTTPADRPTVALVEAIDVEAAKLYAEEASNVQRITAVREASTADRTAGYETQSIQLARFDRDSHMLSPLDPVWRVRFVYTDGPNAGVPRNEDGEPTGETYIRAYDAQEATDFVERGVNVERTISVVQVQPDEYAAHPVTDVQKALREQWMSKAFNEGTDAAEAAASWIVDGNSDVEGARRLLSQLQDGDPAADDFLPARPDLSGEFADAPTPQTLFAAIVGRDPESIADGELMDALADAWEEGVSDAFTPACERQLIDFTR